MADLGAGGSSSFPGSLDDNPTPEDGTGNTTHNPGEGAINAAIAVQTELGTNPAGNLSTMKAYLAVDHDDDGKHDVLVGTNKHLSDYTHEIDLDAEHVTTSGKHTMKTPLMFFQDNVAASQTAVALSLSQAGGGAFVDMPMPFNGSVVGIAVYSNEARSAGTLIVDVTVGGVATGLQATLDGTNTTIHSASQAIDLDTFNANDLIGVDITTDGSWAPATAEIVVVILVSLNG